jgi:hypothetical protein
VESDATRPGDAQELIAVCAAAARQVAGSERSSAPRRAGRLRVLLAALGGPHAERTRADDEQDAQEHEAGRVIGFP